MDQSDLFKAVVRAKFHVSSRLSPSAASIIQGLLTKDPALRLGSLAGGSDDILNHEFLKSIDQEKLRRKEITAPFVPKIKNPLDASNFEDWSHLEDKTLNQYPPLPREKEAIFEKF
jgi:serine/threonine protein kinase